MRATIDDGVVEFGRRNMFDGFTEGKYLWTSNCVYILGVYSFDGLCVYRIMGLNPAQPQIVRAPPIMLRAVRALDRVRHTHMTCSLELHIKKEC